MSNLHTIAIVIHATSATAAFIVGVVLIYQQRDTVRQLQLGRALLVLLTLMEVFLVIAILSHLTSLPTITQVIFWGLVILGLYMIWRAVQAWSVLQAQNPDQVTLVDHVGFILISLFDGFAIITSIDLKAPGWLVAVIAIGAIVLGIYAINARKRALTMRTT